MVASALGSVSNPVRIAASPSGVGAAFVQLTSNHNRIARLNLLNTRIAALPLIRFNRYSGHPYDWMRRYSYAYDLIVVPY
jgi:hypothetical protein